MYWQFFSLKIDTLYQFVQFLLFILMTLVLNLVCVGWKNIWRTLCSNSSIMICRFLEHSLTFDFRKLSNFMSRKTVFWTNSSHFLRCCFLAEKLLHHPSTECVFGEEGSFFKNKYNPNLPLINCLVGKQFGRFVDIQKELCRKSWKFDQTVILPPIFPR